MLRIRITTELPFDHVPNNTAFIGWRIYVLYAFVSSEINNIFTFARVLKIPWDRNVNVRLYRHGYSCSRDPDYTSGICVNCKMYSVTSYIPQSVVLGGIKNSKKQRKE